ncbi:MAG: TolC family protein [Spirochaetia bacterium]|nr:TolC family protein [Spirochaetia bacterium]
MKARAASLVMVFGSSCYYLCSCVGFYTQMPAGSTVLLETHGRDKGAHVVIESLSVQEAASLSINNNIELKAEADSIELREVAWRLGFRSYLPGLDIDASSDERLSLYAPDSFNKTVSLSLSQVLWDGGRLATARSLEHSELGLLYAEHQRKMRTAGEEAVSAYRSVVAARARLDIKHRSLEAASVERSILKTEIDLGLAKAMDILIADLKLSGMELAISGAELELVQAEEVLAEALGLSILPALSDGLSLGRQPVCLDTTRLGDIAIARSPVLEQARQTLISRGAELRAATFSWFPTIGLKAKAQVAGTTLPLNRFSWSLGLSIDFMSPFVSGGTGLNRGSQPPFDTTANSHSVIKTCSDVGKVLEQKAARLALEIEEERYKALSCDIRRKAEAAVLAYANAAFKRDIALKALSLAESMSELVATQIRLGQALRNAAIEAELSRSEKEIDLIDAVTFLATAERNIESLLDILPGSLALFLENMPTNSSDEDADCKKNGIGAGSW